MNYYRKSEHQYTLHYMLLTAYSKELGSVQHMRGYDGRNKFVQLGVGMREGVRRLSMAMDGFEARRVNVLRKIPGSLSRNRHARDSPHHPGVIRGRARRLHDHHTASHEIWVYTYMIGLRMIG